LFLGTGVFNSLKKTMSLVLIRCTTEGLSNLDRAPWMFHERILSVVGVLETVSWLTKKPASKRQ
jgi:hypothetical protein